MPQFPRFWAWYERHYVWHLWFAAGLFTLQLVHLYWLTADVVFLRILGESAFSPTPLWEYIIIAVDYTEILAIITTSTLYIYELKKEWRWKHVLFLLFLNSQWLHIFWITDEFVVSQFRGGHHHATIMPTWLAWIAIFIDYLELPVIIDMIRRSLFFFFKRKELTRWQRIKNAARRYLWRL